MWVALVHMPQKTVFYIVMGTLFITLSTVGCSLSVVGGSLWVLAGSQATQSPRRKISLLLGVLIMLLLWLNSHAWLAAFGYFIPQEESVPTIFLSLGIGVLLLPVVWLFPQIKAYLSQIPQSRFLYFQTLQLGVAALLHYGSLEGVFPRVLSWEAGNYLWLVGLSAPLMAFLLQRQQLPEWLFYCWQVLAFVVFIQVLFIGYFSADTLWQRLSFDEVHGSLFFFPYIWIWSFVLPFSVATLLTSWFAEPV